MVPPCPSISTLAQSTEFSRHGREHQRGPAEEGGVCGTVLGGKEISLWGAGSGEERG